MLSRIRRPSPALVLAFIAVFLLGAGGATGASKLIDGKNLKKGSVSLSKLSKGAKRGITGPTGAQGIPGAKGEKGEKGDKGDAGTAATRLWGVVAVRDGLVRSSGVTRVVRYDGVESEGITDVEFSQDVSNCAVIASVGQSGNAPDRATGFIETRYTSPKIVRVETRSPNDVLRFLPFNIAAFCA
jgi:hypothetical protein